MSEQSKRPTQAKDVPVTRMTSDRWTRFLELTCAGCKRAEAEKGARLTSYAVQTYLIKQSGAKDQYDQAKLDWLRRDMDYAVIEEICEKVAGGVLMKIACKEAFIETYTFYRWILRDPIVKEMYDEARVIQSEAMMDDMMEVADDTSNDIIETPDGDRPNNAAVTRSRIMLEQRRWQVSKMVPRRFSEKTFAEVESNVNINQSDRLDAARRRIEEFNKARGVKPVVEEVKSG